MGLVLFLFDFLLRLLLNLFVFGVEGFVDEFGFVIDLWLLLMFVKLFDVLLFLIILVSR